MLCDGRFHVECPVTDKPSPNLGTRNRHTVGLRSKHLFFPPLTGDRARSLYISALASRLPNLDALFD